MSIASIPTVENVTKDRRDFFQRESYQRVFNESRSLHRLAGDEEGKGEGFKGDGDCDEGGERQRGNGDSGKSDGDGDNGGRRAMAMATKRVLVTATRVGEDGERRNGQW